MSNWTATPTTITAITPRSRNIGQNHIGSVTVIGPTVSLDARPIVVPILSCVFGFPVLALVIICALRYRAKRLRKQSQLKRLQAASARWRHQDDQFRSAYSVSDIQREVSFTIRLSMPRDPVLLLEIPSDDSPTPSGKGELFSGTGRKSNPPPGEQNGKFLLVPTRPHCDMDIMEEHSQVDFEYSEIDGI